MSIEVGEVGEWWTAMFRKACEEARVNHREECLAHEGEFNYAKIAKCLPDEGISFVLNNPRNNWSVIFFKFVEEEAHRRMERVIFYEDK